MNYGRDCWPALNGRPPVQYHVLSHTQNMIWEKDHAIFINWNGVVYIQGKRCMYWKRDSLHTFRSLEDKISGNAKMQW